MAKVGGRMIDKLDGYDLLEKISPFHFLCDYDGQLKSLGRLLVKCVGSDEVTGQWDDYFKVLTPGFKDLATWLTSRRGQEVCILKLKDQALTLIGSFLPAGHKTLVFVCQPAAESFPHIKTKGIGYTDFHPVDSGRTQWVNGLVSQHGDWADGNVQEALKRDAHHRLSQIEYLEGQLEDVAKVSRDRENFLAMMSHEIRTPLNSIIGFTELILDNPNRPPDEFEKEMNMILSSGNHMLEIANGILDLSKVESGKTPAKMDRFSIKNLLQELSEIIHPLLRFNNNSFEIEWEGDHDEMRSDRKKIKQILLNLVGNALKFTNGGMITLKIVEKKAYHRRGLEFSVTDTGKGIDEDAIGSIFDSFVRVGDSDEQEIQGSGLGLAITKKLCEVIAGNISVTSQLGKGTSFFVHLPDMAIECLGEVLSVKRGIADVKSEKITYNKNSPNRILVVDDNRANLLMTRKLLRRIGFGMDDATNGQEASDKILDNGYDLVLMDYDMRPINGAKATRIVREKESGRRTIIVAVTGHGTKEVIDECYQAGMDDVLIKPVTLDVVRKKIPELLAQKRRSEKKPSSQNVKVMIVDDQEENRVLYKMYLKKCGGEVIVARDGFEAVELYKEQHPEVIYMDCEMPGMGGLEAVQRIREYERETQHHQAVIAMISGHEEEEKGRDSITAGCNTYLVKPVKLPDFLEVLERAVVSDVNTDSDKVVDEVDSDLPSIDMLVVGNIAALADRNNPDYLAEQFEVFFEAVEGLLSAMKKQLEMENFSKLAELADAAGENASLVGAARFRSVCDTIRSLISHDHTDEIELQLRFLQNESRKVKATYQQDVLKRVS